MGMYLIIVFLVAFDSLPQTSVTVNMNLAPLVSSHCRGNEIWFYDYTERVHWCTQCLFLPKNFSLSVVFFQLNVSKNLKFLCNTIRQVVVVREKISSEIYFC